MSIELGKDSIDIGIVVRDGEAALKCYRDALRLEHVADTPADREVPRESAIGPSR